MTGKPETIIILTPGFPSNESDSNCLPLQQSLVKAMTRQNTTIQFIVISFQYPFEKKTYQWNGITVMAAGGSNKGGLNRRMIWRKITRWMEDIHSSRHIIGIISFWCDEAALTGSRFANTHGLKHYCWICGQDAKAGNKMVKRIKPREEELVALSDFICEEFKKNHQLKPAHIILPGIDAALFTDNKNDRRPVDLLAAGALIPLKQYSIFLETISELLPQFPGLKAAVCGEGPERKLLEKTIQQLQLQDSVILTGDIPHAELLLLMQQTKIFVHPSSYEGFGMVQAEALHAGAAVVSFVRPLHRDVPGWHIVSDKKAMKEKITELLLSTAPLPAIWNRPIDDTAKEFMQLFLS